MFNPPDVVNPFPMSIRDILVKLYTSQRLEKDMQYINEKIQTHQEIIHVVDYNYMLLNMKLFQDIKNLGIQFMILIHDAEVQLNRDNLL